ncbi:PA2779 family protein [Alkalimarinus coralli]|uniref:PA2779 family protein n=1 Tax=Alkalimarinus coralli TaxID=2935863 RepID=UPI00202B7021|nr:PA2779 family protein [Alkalimarinus coralli]
MHSILAFRRFVSSVMMCAIFLVGMQVSVANAKMVSTATVISTEQNQLDREFVLDRLSESQAESIMVDMGVDPELVKQRVSNMTDEELAQFNAEFEQLPAGGDSIVGLVILVFLILIVLDLLGTTNIFPAIKPIN